MSQASASQPPSVLVLLAARNGREWLPEQLASILNQQQVRVRIAISLDVSTDGTEEWLRQLAVEETRLEILPPDQPFGSAARNFYRLLRDGDFTGVDAVALADQDDIWHPDRLNRALSKLASGYAAYSSDVEAFWANGKRRVLRKSQPQRPWDFLFESAGPGCSFVFTTAFARDLQSWLQIHWANIQAVRHHDWLIYAYARAHGFSWIIDPYPGIAYRQHTANELGARVGLSGIWHRAGRVWGGDGFTAAARVAELVGLGNHPFVQPWRLGQRRGFFSLAIKATQCRRYWLDQLLFALLCVKAGIRGK